MSIVPEDIQLSVVRATEKDTQAVFEIINECSQWLAEHGMNHWINYYDERRIAVGIRTKEVYLLKTDKENLATISLSKRAPQYYYPMWNEEKEDHTQKFLDPKAEAFYVTALGVRPSQQGKGYAKHLMRFAEERATQEGIRFLRMDVRGDYDELVEFYERLGYKIVGEMPDEDSNYYLMEKDLEQQTTSH